MASRVPRRRRQRYAAAFAVGLVILPAALASAPSPAGAPAPTPVPATSPPIFGPAPSGQVPSGQVPSGQVLYGQNCASCHGVQGGGTQLGPSLVGAGPASVDFQLSTGRMPLRGNAYEPRHQKPSLSPAEIDAIVGYLAGLGGPPIPSVRPGPVDAGRTLYAAHCAACHSAAGRGAALSNGQTAPALSQATPTQVGEAIRVGPGVMPAFPEGVLSPDDVNAIAGYIQVLQNKHGDLDRGGLSLGRVGPFTEGLVAWFVGLLALVVVIRWLGSRSTQ